ncbi:MAG: helix-turn-helix transcriptional regulator [Verrucomicrobiales bacterium]|nr:helix-turn-helix transcriptional regulator [Verrucomicrobiales bacterium]
MARIWNGTSRGTTEVNWRLLAQTSSFNSRTLAQLCHISPRQLRRHFNKRFGQSTQAWLDERRMLAAVMRLKELGCVKQVAFELGFKQVSHFCRKFKEFYGVTASMFAKAKVGPTMKCPPWITKVPPG